MNGNAIKPGDLVTVALESNSDASNTYAVARKLDSESLLNHPLFPSVFILKRDEELNQVSATIKNDDERCLSYALKYKKYLDYDTVSNLEATCMFYIVYHTLSNSQKHALASMVGTIASAYCNNDMTKAVELVNSNLPILNEYNRNWYNNFKTIFDGSQKEISRGKRTAIFNIAGFVLAQLEGISSSRVQK